MLYTKWVFSTLLITLFAGMHLLLYKLWCVTHGDVTCYCNFVGNHTSTEEGFDYYTSISFPTHDIIPAYTRHYTLTVDIVPDNVIEENELLRVIAIPLHVPLGQYYCSTDVVILDDDGNVYYNNYTPTVYVCTKLFIG